MSDESQRSAPSRASLPWARVDAVALTLLALAAYCIRLGTKSVVMDEAGSVVTARKSLAALVQQLIHDDPNMGLYYTLLWAWLPISGESEAVVRLPSAVFGALAVGVTYLIGRRLFGRAAGILAGLLLTCNAFMLEYAQTARSYTLFTLLVGLASLCFVALIERPSRRARVGYVLSVAAAVYAHYFTCYVLLAHVVFVAALRSQRQRWREWARLDGAIVVLSLPAVAIVLLSGRSLAWISPSTLAAVPKLFLTFAGQSRAVLLALLIASAWALASARRLGRAWPEWFVATWLLVPIAASFLASLVAPMFEANYLIFCIPALMLLAAAGIARLRPTAVMVVVAGALLLASAQRARVYYARPAIQDWRAATAWVVADRRPDDGVVFFVESGRRPFEYYLRQAGVDGPVDLTHASLDQHERVWFVIRKSDLSGVYRPTFEALHAALTARFRRVERRDFGWVAVELYAR